MLYSLSTVPPHHALFVGTGVTSWLGYSPEELIDTPDLWRQLIHSDDLPRVLADMELILERDVCDNAYRIRHRDGSWRWVRDVVRVVRDAEGNAVELSGRIVDISEARRALHQLAQSEQRYRQLVELANAGVWSVEPGGLTTYVNPQMAEMLGVAVDEMVGHPFALYLDDANLALAQASLERGQQGGAQEFDLRFLRRAGDELWAHVASSPIFDDAGVYEGAFAVITDIGPRKRAEEAQRRLVEAQHAGALRRERDQFIRSIVENITQGYYVTDSDGCFTYCNPAIAIVSGRSVEQLLGTSAFDLVAEEDRARVAESYRRWTVEGAENVTIECRVMSHTGRMILVEQTTQIVRDAEGNVSAFANFLRDITDRRAAEDALRQLTVRLRSIQEQERTRISREIHDVLGQLLTAIRMDLRWLEKHSGQPADEREAKRSEARLTGAVKLVDEALRSVQNIAADLRPGVLDHLGLATALGHELGRYEQRTGTACVLGTVPESLKASSDVETAVFRIFQEIMTNITRHAGASRVMVNLEAQANLLTLTVADNGRGISDSEISDAHSLGLLSMKERAQLLGGGVTITGAPGAGTTVTVQVPVNATEDGDH